MDDTKEADEDAQCGAATASPNDLQAQSVENKEFQEFKDMEIDNEAEHENGENYVKSAPKVAEHFPVNGNLEMLKDGQVSLVEEKIPYPVDTNVKDLGSDSVLLARTLSDVAEDENREEESNDGVPEVLSSAENESAEEELNNDFTPWGDVQKEEEMELRVKEVEVAAKNGKDELAGVFTNTEVQPASEMEESHKPQLNGVREAEIGTPSQSFLLDANDVTGNESGTEEEQAAFMKELETFHRERCLDFKFPKFYQEPLNCLKLWRAVIRLGGYEQVTSLKLWRQVGESFSPPKTCTTVSWTFRGFYEKALLEYEKYKMRSGELPFTDASLSDPISGNQVDLIHASGSGRARRDAAARAMQGWHSQRLLGNGEDKNPITSPKREKQLRNIGFLKRKGSSPVEHAVKIARLASKPHVMDRLEMVVLDVGVPADWVKVNVQRTKDCYEVYALVPGLLREEVRVQSDPAGRLVISGQPEQQDNPWGVTPFKKVVSLPTRIDPHQTSAVVTLHGQLFVRVPFEQSDI